MNGAIPNLKIIMNPPFEGNSKTDRKMLLAMHKQFPDTETVSIQPDKFSDPLADYKSDKMSESCKSVEVYSRIPRGDTNKYFNIVLGTDLAVCGFNNGGDESSKSQFTYNGVDFKPVFDKVVKPCCEHKMKTLKDVVKAIKKEDRKNFAWVRSVIPNFSSEETKYNLNLNLNVNENTGINFKTKTEAENFAKSLQTDFYMFCVWMVKRSPRVQLWALPYMEDYTEPWTDERFFEKFGLNAQEQSLVKTVIGSLGASQTKLAVENVD